MYLPWRDIKANDEVKSVFKRSYSTMINDDTVNDRISNVVLHHFAN